jgi:hypothetical protein
MPDDNSKPQDDVMDARRRAMIFGFGALTTAAAIDALNSAAFATEGFRKYLIEQVAQVPAQGGGPLHQYGPIYRPLTTQLTSQFSAQNINAMATKMRAKFGANLETFKFGGFVADPKDDNSNSYLNNPASFRNDSKRFAPADVAAYEDAMRQNLATSYNGKPGLMWPVDFTIFEGNIGDGVSHLHLNQDSGGAQAWHCLVVCAA